MATWSVQSMTVLKQDAGFTDVVYRVNWLVSGTDSGYEARVGGTTELNPVQPGAPFTDYQNLTELQVIGWVQDVLGLEEVTRLEVSITDQLAYQKNPPIVSLPLPWE